MQQPYSKAIEEIKTMEGDFWEQLDDYFSKFDNVPDDYKITSQDKEYYVSCDFLWGENSGG